MIIFIICAFIFLIGLIAWPISNRTYEAVWLDRVAVFGSIIGGFATLFCTIAILTVQVPAETEYQKALYTKEVLEYRLEQGAEVSGNELLYADIVEFNNMLRDAKKWGLNPWTSWFNNTKIAELEYIEYKQEEPEP